uniref:MAGE domain-containing protein n=1 Tax=Timema genevievae TaxID=629358 RepID=A0A7R9K5U5_TIMGE|nr:unnamed protein product [Timema genevievae]
MDADPLENTPSTGSTQISKEIANPAKWTIGAEKVFSGCGFVTVKSDFMSCSTVKEGKSSGELGYLSCSTIKEARSSGEVGCLSCSTVKEDKSNGELGCLSLLNGQGGQIQWGGRLSELLNGQGGQIQWGGRLPELLNGQGGQIQWGARLPELLNGQRGQIQWGARLSELLNGQGGRILGATMFCATPQNSVANGPDRLRIRRSVVRKKSMPQYHNALSTESLSSIMSQRNSQAAHPALEPEELKGWTANLIQYLVSQSSSKHPVKRSDITKDLGRLNSKDFEVVLKAAKKAMAEVLGLNLVALDQGNSKVYILLSSCGPQSLDAVSREERKHVVLLMIVLSFILMSGGVCRESQIKGPIDSCCFYRTQDKLCFLFLFCLPQAHIWKALQEMNIVKAEKKALHPYFGDVYRLVTQVVAVDPPIHDFRWGKRAELEVSQKAVVEYACEVLHRKPSDFRSIYNEAIRKEQYKGKSDGASTSQQTQALTSVSSSQGSSSQRLLRM